MSTGQRPATAFVLAAGMGNRMRPLTDTIPKPLVPLAGKPLIDHVLDRLAQAHIARAVVNVHYLADKLEAHLSSRKNPEIVISNERDKLLDTGGGVVRALSKIGSGPFLIHNSDTVWLENGSSNIESLITGYDAARMDSLLLLAPRKSSLGYNGAGDFHLEPGGRLRRRTTSETADFVFAGVSIIEPSMFKDESERPFSLNRVWDRALSTDRLFGIVLDGLWMHVGTPEALVEAEEAIAAARRTPSAATGEHA